MEFQKLTIHHYDEDPKEERRITLSPANIAVVAACIEDISVKGRSLRKVTVLFLDGASVDLTINHSDLELLEAATGSFCLE
jgi:hypothetical protein